MSYKNWIFDFDGVLAESVQVKTDAFYELYKPFGKEIAEKVVKHHTANGGMSRFEKFPYYHKHFLNIKLSENDVNQLSTEFSNLVVRGVIASEEVRGANWFLEKNGLKQKWIVSATPTNEINEIVETRKLSKYFINIYGSPEKKPPIVGKIIREHKLNKADTVFLGDALSDYEAATENNIDFILRETPENLELFSEVTNIIRFTDYYNLTEKLS
jgi:phosphoglycolate phosphatase-like HAD superfamily hydrolase